ncbi:vWA domain-containing protein [Methylomonas sp. AM2-LC]|uniref:vWA domain-containing protein n=1 Tax=Methylomonas sp. AM2-LC TaxID=3153301 RepID=UPI0032656BEA
MKAILKDFRIGCVVLSMLVLLVMTLYPSHSQKSPIYKVMFIVDITRSMNAEDYQMDDKRISRLEFVKRSLSNLLVRLPCQSQVGLGIFTERRSAILFEPVEVCTGFNELNKSIAALDWRMAWAADSRIASGLLNTLQQLSNKETTLVFISDGQEAPPVNLRYRTDFAEVKGKVKGIIVGAGGLQPVTIPKFNHKGQPSGVYGADDVPQRSSFGEPDLNPEKIEGYDARNAPFGRAAAKGIEHLSALHESYLLQLAAETGLQYHRLQDSDELWHALQIPEFALPTPVEADIRGYYAAAVLILLIVFHF